MMKKYLLLLIALVILSVGKSYAQTHTISYNVDWHTENQDMWGPDGNVFTMDTVINLFDVDEADSTSVGFIENIFGGDFGAALIIDYWLKMGLNFTIDGFSTGSVDVNYPTQIDLTLPDDYSWNPGQTVTIGSDYSVEPGWSLDSHFPTTGSIGFDLYFGFNIDVDATICVWSCTTFDVFEYGVPLDTTVLFSISDTNGVASVTYPWYDPAIGFYFAHDTILPLVFNNLGGIGLSGVITLPYVETTDYMIAGDKCLYAKGDSAYVHLDLDILTFLSAFDPDLAAIIDQLNGTIDLGAGISVDYSLLTMNLLAESYMVQDFSFCPKIYAHLSFPMNLSYTETDPANGGALINAGNNDTLVFQVDHDLNITFPCSGPSTYPFGVYFSMDNDFRNHTWDSIAFTFVLTAFTFTLNLPSFPIMPDVCLPDYCLLVPVACEDKSPGDPQCFDTLCMTGICTPAVSVNLPDPSYTIGPLIDLSIPLGYIPLTWFDETWELQGFQPNLTGAFDTIVPGSHITPNPPMTTDIEGPPVICYGDTAALITAIVHHGTPPYTYTWSTGEVNTVNDTTNTITVGVGTYTVTISDVNGCSGTETHTIWYVNPQMFSSLSKLDVNCAGDSTGWIHCLASGGTPGYTYEWEPYGGTQDTASGLCAGLYVVTITDSVECTLQDSITLIELHPLPLVNFTGTPLEGCQPLVVSFNETSPDEGQTYEWHFGDGITDTLADPTHIYDTMGTFDVSLTVVSVYGCDSTMFRPAYVLVHPKPVAEFIFDPATVLATVDPTWTVHFSNQSTYANTWTWDFADGTTVEDQQILVHSWAEEGLYNVTLYVTSEYGCLDTVTHVVEIIDDILHLSNVITPNNDGFNDYLEIVNIEKYPNNRLVIYNRWGTVVYEQYHYRNTWKAEGIADGVYYFLFESGKEGDAPIQGTLTIMR